MTDKQFNKFDYYQLKTEEIDKMTEKQLHYVYDILDSRCELALFNAKYKTQCKKAMKYIAKLLKKIQKEK